MIARKASRLSRMWERLPAGLERALLVFCHPCDDPKRGRYGWPTQKIAWSDFDAT